MAERGHKRKRGIQDTPTDLSKVRMALNSLGALQAELGGIEETEEEVASISKHVAALEEILKRAKRPRVTPFSTVTEDDLMKAGVVNKYLFFRSDKITELLQGFTPDVNAEIKDLHSRIKKIYSRVNMDFEAGSRMILDAILLSLAEICSFEQRSIIILPEMRIPTKGEIRLTHPVTGFELWLSGNVDYAIIEYKNHEEVKNRLLGPRGSRHDVFKFSTGRFFLVEAKCQGDQQMVHASAPEAVSQAISLMKSMNATEMRFCLSDGRLWIFFVLQSEGTTLAVYESAVRRLDLGQLDISDKPLREILLLVSEWVRPTAPDLIILGEGVEDIE